MRIFCNPPFSPLRLSWKKENVIRSPDNYPQKRTILVPLPWGSLYLFRFSIFMHILLVHVDTETFVHLTCTYTLTLWALRWGESVYPHPLEQCFFITPTIWGIEMKLWPSRQGFPRNSLRSKLHHSANDLF